MTENYNFVSETDRDLFALDEKWFWSERILA